MVKNMCQRKGRIGLKPVITSQAQTIPLFWKRDRNLRVLSLGQGKVESIHNRRTFGSADTHGTCTIYFPRYDITKYILVRPEHGHSSDS